MCSINMFQLGAADSMSWRDDSNPTTGGTWSADLDDWCIVRYLLRTLWRESEGPKALVYTWLCLLTGIGCAREVRHRGGSSSSRSVCVHGRVAGAIKPFVKTLVRFKCFCFYFWDRSRLFLSHQTQVRSFSLVKPFPRLLLSFFDLKRQ